MDTNEQHWSLSVGRAIQKLPDSKLKAEHSDLIDFIILVLKNWHNSWKDDPAVKPWLNRGKSFLTEVEEAVFPLSKVFHQLKSAPIDQYVVKRPTLIFAGNKLFLICVAHRVKRIIMVDLNFSFDGKTQKTGKTIKMDHITAINLLSPVPLVPVKSNLHLLETEQLINTCCSDGTNSILVGIHLCRRLASRFIEIFNSTPTQCFILAPCCTPNSGGAPFSILHSPQATLISPSEIHASPDPYLCWTDHLFSSINVSESQKWREQIDLSGGAHRCNTFMCANKWHIPPSTTNT